MNPTIFVSRAGSIVQVAGRPGSFRVVDPAGQDVTGTQAVDMASAFRLLNMLAKSQEER